MTLAPDATVAQLSELLASNDLRLTHLSYGPGPQKGRPMSWVASIGRRSPKYIERTRTGATAIEAINATLAALPEKTT